MSVLQRKRSPKVAILRSAGLGLVLAALYWWVQPRGIGFASTLYWAFGFFFGASFLVWEGVMSPRLRSRALSWALFCFASAYAIVFAGLAASVLLVHRGVDVIPLAAFGLIAAVALTTALRAGSWLYWGAGQGRSPAAPFQRWGVALLVGVALAGWFSSDASGWTRWSYMLQYGLPWAALPIGVMGAVALFGALEDRASLAWASAVVAAVLALWSTEITQFAMSVVRGGSWTRGNARAVLLGGPALLAGVAVLVGWHRLLESEGDAPSS